MGKTQILGDGLIESALWSDHVSVAARWLFICLLLRTDDKGEISVDEDYRVCSEISGLGIQSSEIALAELERAKLITVFDNGVVTVHRIRTFRYRQSESQVKSNERVRRFRERSRNGVGNAPPPHTPPRESTSSTSSTSTVLDNLGGPPVQPSSEDKKPKKPKKTDEEIRKETGFDEFWDAYGKKTSTKKALTAWKNLTKRDRKAAMGAVAAYVAATPEIRFRKNPTTWINQRCWEDEMVAPHKPPKREYLPEAGEIDF